MSQEWEKKKVHTCDPDQTLDGKSKCRKLTDSSQANETHFAGRKLYMDHDSFTSPNHPSSLSRLITALFGMM